VGIINAPSMLISVVCTVASLLLLLWAWQHELPNYVTPLQASFEPIGWVWSCTAEGTCVPGKTSSPDCIDALVKFDT
jgi:hypothetical protein